MPSDPISQAYDALWAALEADSAIATAVKVGNRLKYAGAGRVPPKVALLSGATGTAAAFGAADYPQIVIRQGNRTHRYNRAQTFGRCVLPEEITIHWLLALTVDDLRLALTGPLEDAIDGVLAAAWKNRLGLPLLVTWIDDVNVRSEEKTKGDAAGSFRRITTWDIPIRVAFAR